MPLWLSPGASSAAHCRYLDDRSVAHCRQHLRVGIATASTPRMRRHLSVVALRARGGRVELVDDLENLRPLERRVRRLAAAGVVPAEIGRRFRRGGDYIERVLVFSEFPGRRPPVQRQGLRPLERRLLRWREQGASPQELADRFRRGPAHIERVLALVDYKLEHSRRER
jgi:DNA-binding CsgD family transcriptional regulator